MMRGWKTGSFRAANVHVQSLAGGRRGVRDRHHYIEEPCAGKPAIGPPKRHGFGDRRGWGRLRRV